MVRDFTQATREKLIKEIDDINQSTWSPVTDFIGDIFLYDGKWLGVLSLNEDMSNVESYQRCVLDMTDMTKKELNEIFDEVYDIDKTFEGYFSDINERIEIYNEKMKYLYGIIQPNFNICSAATISAETSLFNAQLQWVDGKINGNLKNELDWAAKEAALEATKGLISSGLKLVVDVVTLPVTMVKHIVTNPAALVSDAWSLIDGAFAVGGNLAGLAIIGIGSAVSFFGGSDSFKHSAVLAGEAYAGSSGMTDVIKAEQKLYGKNFANKILLKTSQFMDNVSTVCDLTDTAKTFIEKPSKMVDLKFGFKNELGTIKKADMLEKYQDNYRSWQSLYSKLGKSTHYVTLKNISKGYKYASSLWEVNNGTRSVADSAHKTVMESGSPLFKALGDSYDYVTEDLKELLTY